MQNNRKHERYNHRLSVQLKDRKGSHPLKTGNISRFGLFLITSDVKNLRELIKLEVQLPHSGRNLEILAQVMWVDKEGKSSNPGMGVKFFSMPDDIKREWEQFVDMVRTGRVQETPPDLPEDNPMHSGNRACHRRRGTPGPGRRRFTGKPGRPGRHRPGRYDERRRTRLGPGSVRRHGRLRSRRQRTESGPGGNRDRTHR